MWNARSDISLKIVFFVPAFSYFIFLFVFFGRYKLILLIFNFLKLFFIIFFFTTHVQNVQKVFLENNQTLVHQE